MGSVNAGFSDGSWQAQLVNNSGSGSGFNPMSTYGGINAELSGFTFTSLTTSGYFNATSYSAGSSISVGGELASSTQVAPQSYEPPLDYFTGYSSVDTSLLGYVTIGSPSSDVSVLGGQISSTHTIQYKYNITPQASVVLNTGSDTPFSDQLVVLPISANNSIGVAENVEGVATITRENGTQETLSNEMSILMNDVIETDVGASVALSLEDGSTFNISGNSRLGVDEYVYDPSAESGVTNFSVLRGAYAFTKDLIGNNDENSDPDVSSIGFGVGIRGDAADYIDPALLDVAVTMNAGSPVSLYTAVDVPDEEFTFGFDYSFFDESGILDVTIGGHTIFSATAGDYAPGEMFNLTTTISDQVILNLLTDELSFNYDGETGTQLLLDNIVFGGLDINGDFSLGDANWFSSGMGNVELVGVVATPIPAAAWLFGSGLLGLIGVARRKKS